jgi:SPP1 gp7 family putative phage head morphogenesis protein
MLNVPFKEAIGFARSRGVVLPDTYYSKLKGAARSAAFTVSHVGSLRQIESVLGALNDTIRDGGTFKDFTKKVEAGGVALTAHHRETVFRTGVQTAYNAGRRDQQNDAAEDRPFLMYDAINDSRTRPAHRAMDGYIAPVGHPVWKRWYPPCGYNCRCSVISLTEAQAKARGYTGRVRTPSVDPDPGFDHDPADGGIMARGLAATGAAARQVLAKLPAKVQRAAGKWVIRAARKQAKADDRRAE